MKIRIIQIWNEIRTSYWFVPALLVSVAIALSYLTIALDQRVQAEWVRRVG